MKFRGLIIVFFLLLSSVCSYGQYYRSAVSGSWSTASNWESSSDNITWTTSTNVPDNSATAITIRNLYDITISVSVTADDIKIESGATLTLAGGTFTLNNGVATTDMEVLGTFTYNGGTFNQNTSAGLFFGPNATYNHSIASTTLTLPIASWDATSNCNVTGMINATPITGVNMGQAFGNFTWNNPGQVSPMSYVNIQSSDFSVAGTMTVGPSINNVLSFGNTGIYTNTVNRLVVSGGNLMVSGNANVTLNVINDVVVTGTDSSNYGSFVISGGSGLATLNIGTDLAISVSGYMQVLSVANSPNQTVTVGRDLLISGALGSQLNLEVVSAPGVATLNINRDFSCITSNLSIPAVDFGDGNVSNNIINIGRNFNKSGDGFFTTSSNTNFAIGFSFNGIGNQTFSYTGTNSLYTSYIVQSSSTLIMNSNLTLGFGLTPASRFTIDTGGALNFGTYSIIAGNTTDPRFTANRGSTLITANNNGIGGTTATGSLQGFGTVGINPADGRAAFATYCNYTFNGNTITPFPNFGPGILINIVILNVNATVTSNIENANIRIGLPTGLSVGALNVNNGGTFILNANNNHVQLYPNSSLNISNGGVFDNNGENRVAIGGGTPSINISGKFITRDVQGFIGINTSIPAITPTLNIGSTVEYGLNGDQAVQGLTAPTYHNITFSGSGTKTLAGGNAVAGTITVSGSVIFDASNHVFGGVGTNIIMTGTSVYKLSGAGLKPEAAGTYSLAPGTTFEFYGAFGTNIRAGVSSPVIAYYNVIVNGTNVSNTNTIDGIQFQSGGTFTVKNGATFKLNNTAGFNGANTTAVSSNNNPIIVLETGSNVEYAGDNQTITLFNAPFYTNVTISGTGTKSLQNTTQTFINEDLNINGSILLVNTNEVLTVRKAVKIATVVTTDIPDFQIKNHGQLIQIDETDANTGINAKVERIATVNKNDYVYWSSPTVGFDMATIPSNGGRYNWNTTFVNLNGTQGNWSGASGTMIKGKGYAIGVPNSSPIRPAAPTSLITTFTGKLNNGQFTFPIFRGNYSGADYDADLANPTNSFTTKFDDNWNLVGNPYPSAIDAEKFLNLNPTNIEGTVWIWKHGLAPTSTTSPFYSNFGYNYSSTDYLKYNRLGATDTNFAGVIASGQGFMVCMKEGTGTLFSGTTGIPTRLRVYSSAITFNNNLRSVDATFASYDNTDFYRSNPNQIETLDEKHRIWLDIINNTSNQIDTTLLGYASNATMEKDNFYDAIFVPRGDVNLYSLINDESFIIQGRSLPFNENDIVPMGINIVSDGSHTIAIKKTDGMFVNDVSIYLEDKQLNIIHDLKQSPYVFSSQSGVFNNRFLLRYTNDVLGNIDFVTLNNSVVVATNKDELTIKSSIVNIQDITVYDLLGRQLFEAKGINNTNFMASTISSSQQALIVKIKLENGTILTKKVLL
ncbi:MAG: hypothetical protein RL705_1600 [Bacteroidota bacterium]|jgi:hypothetical protein